MRPPTVQVIYANKNDGRKEGRKLISLSLNLEGKGKEGKGEKEKREERDRLQSKGSRC
jgi:hypothetical protein